MKEPLVADETSFRTLRTIACLAAVLTVLAAGCNVRVSPPANDNSGTGNGNDNGSGGVSGKSLQVAFEAEGGHFAVAEDDDGNEYTFRAREADSGEMTFTEAVIRTSNGQSVVASLDDQGRPVNYRAADSTNTDIRYAGVMAFVRFTSSDGAVTEAEIDVSQAQAAQELVVSQSNPTSNTQTLRTGLSVYAEFASVLFSAGGANPLTGSQLETGAELLIGVSAEYDVVEVNADVLSNVTIDSVPGIVQTLAGNTYVLFDAEGLCLEQTGAINRLTFDVHGLLQNEFDRNVVFPDFGAATNNQSGVTINYVAGTPIVLNPGDATGFTALVTPVFTSTSIDQSNRIVIERRFLAESSFTVQSITGETEMTTVELFDAALVNGELSADGSQLAFDLLLVDLLADNPVQHLGRLRYHNQNVPEPISTFGCVTPSINDQSSIVCPIQVSTGEPFEVSYIFSREDEDRLLTFDWFVSGGLGVVLGDPFSDTAEVVAMGGGLIKVSLIVSDLTDGSEVPYRVFTCDTLVDDELAVAPPEDLFIECPIGLNVGESGFFNAGGSVINELDFVEWAVFGIADVLIFDTQFDSTEIVFFQPGRFDVVFSGFNSLGTEVYASCEVVIGAPDQFDICTINDWYGDGICDEFCPSPDIDCEGEVFFDPCEESGYYGDGICDGFCPFPDPDCDDLGVDICAESGFYGDGVCDLFCLDPDPDCETFDICEDLGYYGDGFCDEFCPLADPDCDFEDECLDNGYYGDGICDDFCLLPDPDCDGNEDLCETLGLYGDGFCDDFCAFEDPDCGDVSEDVCAELGFYGDGICDDFCLLPDPDCTGGEDDICEELGLYGDGICDDFCPFVDPDC